MNIQVKLEGVEKALKMFNTRIVNQATRMALNETAKTAKTTAAGNIYHGWNLKKSDINKKLKTELARSSDLSAALVVRSESFSLSYFGAKQFSGRRTISRTGIKTGKRKSSKGGVYVRIKRGGKITHLSTSFIAATRSGHIGVFRRSTRKHLPIAERRLITVPSMFKQQDVYVPTLRAASRTWSTRLKHHLERLTR